MSLGIELMERGWVPDGLVRRGIRGLLRERLQEEAPAEGESREARLGRFISVLKDSPIALHTDAANDQHYEIPAAFYQYALGARRKYSGALWEEGTETLDAAEDAMLELYGERAELADGQDILELGCGWGSLTLWMAERYPGSRITAVSNSASQRAYIESLATTRRLSNVRVITEDMNAFEAPGTYDRVVSIEMFEHMRNYRELLRRVSTWLKDDGKLFVHIFSHRDLAYPFETDGAKNWMGRYFFTGGIMPSHDLLMRFNDHLTVEADWVVNGKHYRDTAEAWLQNLDANRERVMPILEEVYGRRDAARWYRRWRVFFMACAELFGYRDGREWGVSHYRFVKTGNGGS
jgi:cyclopropane-fatty-acyl-phospholipid synthase